MKKIILILLIAFFYGILYLSDGLPINECNAGECLQSRQEMLDDFNNAITEIMKSYSEDHDLGPWIERCWYHWDPDYPNGELNEELGNAILKVLKNRMIPRKIKKKCIEIASMAAPANLFDEIVRLVESGDYDDINFRALLEIWAYNAKNNPKIANYNYISLFKRNLPEAFTPPFKDLTYTYDYGAGKRLETLKDYWLCSFYGAMGKVYAFDYAKAKNILIAEDLFYPTYCAFGQIFKDPRAFEDAKYQGAQFESALFLALLRHLDLDFKEEWVDKLQVDQLRLLRNGILAMYGWKFKEKKLHDWFASHTNMVCRNGACGVLKNSFSDVLLTSTDKRNIELIKKFERQKSE